MYFCLGEAAEEDVTSARSRASSSDNSFVGVDTASDLGRVFFGVPAIIYG